MAVATRFERFFEPFEVVVESAFDVVVASFFDVVVSRIVVDWLARATVRSGTAVTVPASSMRAAEPVVVVFVTLGRQDGLMNLSRDAIRLLPGIHEFLADRAADRTRPSARWACRRDAPQTSRTCPSRDRAVRSGSSSPCDQLVVVLVEDLDDVTVAVDVRELEV